MRQANFGVHLRVSGTHLDDEGFAWAQQWHDDGIWEPEGFFLHHVSEGDTDAPKCWRDIFVEARRRGVEWVLVEEDANVPEIEGLPVYERT